MSDFDYGARARLDYIETAARGAVPRTLRAFRGGQYVGMPPGVVELARAGKTIAAIKEYRNVTGAGLAEAKAPSNRSDEPASHARGLQQIAVGGEPGSMVSICISVARIRSNRPSRSAAEPNSIPTSASPVSRLLRLTYSNSVMSSLGPSTPSRNGAARRAPAGSRPGSSA